MVEVRSRGERRSENKQSFVFDYDSNSFEEFLLRYYSENEIPKELINLTRLSCNNNEIVEIPEIPNCN